jgi:hypothetical protein
MAATHCARSSFFPWVGIGLAQIAGWILASSCGEACGGATDLEPEPPGVTSALGGDMGG